MKQFTPVYGVDYKAGTIAFTLHDSNGLSTGISWIESFEEATSFIEEIRKNTYSPDFKDTDLKKAPSHVFIVVNEKRGVESAEKGVEFFDLHERINDPHLRIVFRELEGFTQTDCSQMISKAFNLAIAEKSYDYTGLVGRMISIFNPLNKIPFPPFSWINKLPNPLNIGGLYCSAFVARCIKAIERLRKIKVLKQNHATRIDPVILWYCFPWQPLKYKPNKEVL